MKALIKVTQEVKQADALSSIIFNLVLDYLLRSLLQKCGSTYNKKTIRAMASADDLVQLTDRPVGFQNLLKRRLTSYGPVILQCTPQNHHMSHSLDGQRWRSKEDSGRRMPNFLRRGSTFARAFYVGYLELSGNSVPAGRMPTSTVWESLPMLVSLTFHCRDCVLEVVPGNREQNITTLNQLKSSASAHSSSQKITSPVPPQKILRRGESILHQLVDGDVFKYFREVTKQHNQVDNETSLLTGKNYSNYHKVKIGALPIRSRTTRGKHGDKRYRMGYMSNETDNYILQI